MQRVTIETGAGQPEVLQVGPGSGSGVTVVVIAQREKSRHLAIEFAERRDGVLPLWLRVVIGDVAELQDGGNLTLVAVGDDPLSLRDEELGVLLAVVLRVGQDR